MQATRLAIPDVVLLRPKRHGDARGYFVESYNGRTFRRSSRKRAVSFDGTCHSALPKIFLGTTISWSACSQPALSLERG